MLRDELSCGEEEESFRPGTGCWGDRPVHSKFGEFVFVLFCIHSAMRCLGGGANSSLLLSGGAKPKDVAANPKSFGGTTDAEPGEAGNVDFRGELNDEMLPNCG